MINRMENRTVVLDWLKDQQNYSLSRAQSQNILRHQSFKLKYVPAN